MKPALLKPGQRGPQRSYQPAACDKRSIAFHEAGHCVVVQHFGMDWTALIVRAAEATDAGEAWEGIICHESLPPFRDSVCGWAGPLAEKFARGGAFDALDGLIQFELDPLWASPSDRTAIRSHHQYYRAAKSAEAILWRYSATLHRIASVLMERSTLRRAEFTAA